MASLSIKPFSSFNLNQCIEFYYGFHHSKMADAANHSGLMMADAANFTNLEI